MQLNNLSELNGAVQYSQERKERCKREGRSEEHQVAKLNHAIIEVIKSARVRLQPVLKLVRVTNLLQIL